MGDPNIRELVEHLARRLGASSGKHRLTFILVDGALVDHWSEARTMPTDLERLPALAGELLERAAGARD